MAFALLGKTVIGGAAFEWGRRTYIMGIINASPDSFSGDGVASPEAALEQAERMVAEGADMIDVGGESTRPDYAPVPVEEEIKRVVPVISRLASSIKVPISIDTYKIEVAKRALDAGACMLNDVWGLRQEPQLAGLAAERHVPVIIAANQRGQQVASILGAVLAHLDRAMKSLLSTGVPRENIIIDPGIGFGKTVEQNLELIDRLGEIRGWFQRPVLLGTSRKSFIGAVLDRPPQERLAGTAASTAIGIARGADIVRVHDTAEMSLLVKMGDAIVRGNWSRPA
ncbi:MAG: dihydropteroate synthase [Chloroflexota bacterium]